jgi:hypothetical protein
MTQVTQATLAMLGMNTSNPAIFWNGKKVPNVTAVRVDWEAEEHRVKIKVSDIDPALQAEMLMGGVSVKMEKRHE